MEELKERIANLLKSVDQQDFRLNESGEYLSDLILQFHLSEREIELEEIEAADLKHKLEELKKEIENKIYDGSLSDYGEGFKDCKIDIIQLINKMIGKSS